MSNLKIKYQVRDGYVGNRPQYASIHADDLAECESWGEAEGLICECVKEHFEQNVSPDYEANDLRKTWEELRAKAQEENEA